MRRLLITYILIILCVSINAQTVVWQMTPRSYSSIEHLTRDLYLVRTNGKIGIVTSDGTVVAEPVCDELGDYYEHNALMTVADGHGERVVGCLIEDGKYYSYTDKYYTLSGQKFFSDGLLTVSDEYGRKGYIDLHGDAVLGFDGKYDRIKPFVEGHAAVYRKKEYSLIDKNGRAATFLFDGVGAVYGGTNAYNGKVCVWEDDNHVYFYDIHNPGNTLRRVSNIRFAGNGFDYLHRLRSISGMSDKVPFVKRSYSGKIGLKPVAKDGKYGFESGKNMILPFQLSSVTAFEDGYAIASVDGLIGILRYVDGDGFNVQVTSSENDFYLGQSVKCSFTLFIPTIWRDRGISVVVKDSKDATIPTEINVNSYSFTLKPERTENREYRIAVYAERLKLYEGYVSYSFKRLCNICHGEFYKCQGKHEERRQKVKVEEEKCPTCGRLKIECPKNGIH